MTNLNFVVSSPPIQYDIIFLRTDLDPNEELLIRWGEGEKWAEKFADFISASGRVTLSPKEGVNLPVVTLAVSGASVFSRVVGNVNEDKALRLYAVRWGPSTLWVYPDGNVEIADEPTFAEVYLSALLSQ